MDAIYVPPKIEGFCWRIEHAQIREGGFAMVHGDPGSGKSIVLRVLCDRLKRLPDVTVAAINHPQSHLADFYRELGDVFGVPLRPSNRWGGFKALRERWLSHMQMCIRDSFMPSVEITELPQSLVARFTGTAHEVMGHLLKFLSPLSVQI